MSALCAICGKGTLSGFKVSHSHRRTKRRFRPNLMKKKLPGRQRSQFVCAKCFKSLIKKRSSRAGGPPES